MPVPTTKRPRATSSLNESDSKNNNKNYDDDDGAPVSSASAVLETIVGSIGSTTSTVVAGTFFAALCYKRDALMVVFFLGAIGNAVFGKVLKKLLNIKRPEESNNKNNNNGTNGAVDRPNDNGMPSSHAMSLGFIFTFLALLQPTTTLPLLVYASISLVYRVRVNLHTTDQIAVGTVLGSLDGALWWHLCTQSNNALLGSTTLVDFVSSSGIMNEKGLLSWYLLAVPALIGAAVVGSVERKLGKYFRGGSSSEPSSPGAKSD